MILGGAAMAVESLLASARRRGTPRGFQARASNASGARGAAKRFSSESYRSSPHFAARRRPLRRLQSARD